MTISASPCPRAAYRDVCRFKHIDWTWLRANELYEDGGEPLQDFDTPWIQRTLRYIEACAGKNFAPATDATQDFSDIEAAHKVHTAGDLYRDILQSYLLTRISLERIAAQMGLSPATVTAYEQLFLMFVAVYGTAVGSWPRRLVDRCWSMRAAPLVRFYAGWPILPVSMFWTSWLLTSRDIGLPHFPSSSASLI